MVEDYLYLFSTSRGRNAHAPRGIHTVLYLNKNVAELYLRIHHKILCHEKVAKLIYTFIESDEITLQCPHSIPGCH